MPHALCPMPHSPCPMLEYQAKELFREMGIPVLPSQRIDHPRDLKGLQIPYPVVLKSQVRAGGRGRAGGVRFVENTIDAIAAAQTIFNLSILGEYPQVLLAEAKYDVTREFYLAVALDYEVRRPVLLGSIQGGIDLESVRSQMQRVIVDRQFSPFYARRLTLKMGLQGALIQSVSTVIEKMYQLFVQKDLDLVEINPLGVSITGDLMALDGKETANKAALDRHPDLAALEAKVVSQRQEITGSFISLKSVEREGNIGIICNGADLGLATTDLVYQAGGKPASCLSIDWESSWDLSPAARREQLERALERLMQDRNVKVLLVNILQTGEFETASYWKELADAIAACCKNTPENRALPQFVIRLVGGADLTDLENESKIQAHLGSIPVHWVNEMDKAIAQSLSLAKKPPAKS